MADALRHRGPDDSGEWLDAKAGIALGHRRLAVIDLTAAGHQPMESASRRFALAFNGEIYNHLELREEIGSHGWRGHSDTETLLAGIEKWGLDKTLELAVGMFALGTLGQRCALSLSCQGPDGRKAALLRLAERHLFFGSELKALRAHPDFTPEIDRSALALYVQYGYVPSPLTIYSGVSKLAPGAILATDQAEAPVRLSAYWSLRDVIAAREAREFRGEPDDAVAALEALIGTAVKQQQLSDVPIGAFLSGGVDSSTVVALMQASASAPVKTFTIGFEEHDYDEATYAREVALHLKTDHTELYVSAQDAMAVLYRICPEVYDEPFADSSQIPTVLVSRLARQNVTVALSGDGGDELFCGYGRYPNVAHEWQRLSRVPLPLRSVARRLLPHGPLAEGIACANIDNFYQFMNSQWKGCRDSFSAHRPPLHTAIVAHQCVTRKSG